MAHRKLQQEIDRVFKKINEGTEVFDSIHERHQQAENPALREKLEGELKREVKKLQKLREQVKVWQASSEVKDKDSLAIYRRKVEVAMEEYKVVERGSKLKAYSNTSLRGGGELDPEEKEKMETIQFVQESIDELERQFQVSEVELERLQSKKGKRANTANSAEKEELKEIQQKYRWHQQQLELALRLLENGELDYTQINDIREDIEYFLQNNREPDFAEDEFIYDSLDLEANAVVQREIAEGFAHAEEASYNTTTTGTPSPAKQSRESTPLPAQSNTQSQPVQQIPQQQQQQQQQQAPTPKGKRIVSLGSSSSSPSNIPPTLRPARAPAPAEQVKWSALAAGVDELKEQRERELREQKEEEERERLENERLEREKRDREEKERKYQEGRERAAREEREKRDREEREERDRERQRKEKEREDRDREKRDREERERQRELERERERERKRERRLQSYGLSNKVDEPQQIIITGSSPALLKHLEEKKRLEEERLQDQKEPSQEESNDVSSLSPLDETVFRNDAELMLLPPGIQDIVGSYYAARRTSDNTVSSVAQSVRPPREYLPTNAVPSLTACVELNKALNIWSLVRPQLASAGHASPLDSPSASNIDTAASPTPSNPVSLTAAALNNISGILSKLDSGTLFYAFYYALTPFETSAAEEELIKRQWRADLNKKCWFQRIPGASVKQGGSFEVASYKKFDAETWALHELINYKLDYNTLAVTSPFLVAA